jgi:energy-coupling factor transport system permease protein
LTRLVLSVATLVSAIAASGACLTAVIGIVAVLLPAALARVGRRTLRVSLLLALPLAVSAALVNVLVTPGGSTVLVEVGPLRVTAEGLAVAVQVAVRVLVMAGAVTLFSLTTVPSELVASLLSHGMPARLAFVIHNATAMIGRLADRAADVTAAQRARGLDSEGHLVRRLRGVTALAGPTISGAIAEADERTLALETRGFTRPGRHTLLWSPADSGLQRAARWAMVGGVTVLVLARAAGWTPPC